MDSDSSLPLRCRPGISTRNYTLGILVPKHIMFPFGTGVATKVAKMAVDKANKRCLVPGYHLKFVLVDTRCDSGVTLDNLFWMHNLEEPAGAFVGPFCERVHADMARLTTRWQESVVAFGRHQRLEVYNSSSISSSSSSKLRVHLSGSFRQLAQFVLAVVHHFEWFRGYLVMLTEYSSTSQPGYWYWLRYTLKETYHKKIVFSDISLDNRTRFHREMKKILQTSFVFILCLFPEQVQEFFALAREFGIGKGLIFIAFDFLNFGKWSKNISKNVTASYTGLLDISVDVNYNSPDYIEVTKVAQSGSSSKRIDDCGSNYEMGVHAAEFTDAINVLIKGISRSINDSGNSEFSGVSFHNKSSIIAQYLRNTSFEGLTGRIRISDDLNGDPRFMLHNLVDGCYHPVGRSYYHALDDGTSKITYEPISEPLVWPGGSIHMPTCTPRFCDKSESYTVVLVIYVVIAAIVLGIIFGLGVGRRRIIRDVGRTDWMINSEDLYSLTDRKYSSASKFKMPSRRTAHWASEENAMEQSRDSLKTFAMGQIFAKVTVLDQQVVAIKSLRMETVHLTSEIFAEINQVRNLRHTNVNQLVGACVEPGNVCLVWGYGHKGSLRDVLNNKDFRLDWMFKISFIADIARGMVYIHTSCVGVHGRLKSSNVIVDNNWTCKVTDIYMPNFRLGEDCIADDWQRAHNLLWAAPELLRLNQYPMIATKKGDVYAFAVIIHEILTREQPFGLTSTDNPEGVIMRVMNEENPPYRPRMPKGGVQASRAKKSNEQDDVVNLMMMCWDEYPLFRLPFPTISNNLKKIRRSTGTCRNLADEMLVEMTKYTDLLERQVEDRTMQIQNEKEKADELLARMLPKQVAHDLKMGKNFIPESYQSVTIFFSDIVGFTALAAKSTPLQVVTLLNDLYTVFDNIVDDYDAYKIETIGDAYMVVSGLPVRNGDLHAGEIASTALRILTSVLSFRIRHCPEHHLFLRIGLHTGPVVAGVVGIKMPRYCLFGDTVNFAACMESSGKPLHIHISDECKSYLDKLGGFHTVERGMMTVMGKVNTMTHFLIGKDGLKVTTPWLPRSVRSMVGITVTFMENKVGGAREG